MIDHIVAGYLEAFKTENGFTELSEAELFEQFVNDLIIRQHYPEPFDFESVSMGGGLDNGIDGLAILVNDNIVTDCDMVDYFKEQLKRLDVTFIFIQSKTSASFDSGDMGNFLFGVRQFFIGSEEVLANERIKSAREIKNHLYRSSIDMDQSPICELVYATLGKWQDDAVLIARVKAETDTLRATGLFSEVRFRAFDAERIRLTYRELNRRICKEILFERRCELAAISGVEQAFIGSLPAVEYLKLISDEEGRLQRSLFFDNVRDFQGNNSVNRDITKTLNESELRDKFAVLNNGVTIVARELNQVGPKFKLTDFQIVNGCQTSHILFSAKQQVGKVEIPVKLIITKDPEVANLVTRATNRQTEVKEEAFESLNVFQKELEEFYRSIQSGHSDSIVYERRSKQYAGAPIDKKRIVTLTAQIRSFLAMFFSEPHETYHYYGELMTRYRGKIFVSDHSPYTYYVAARSLASLEQAFASGEVSRDLLPFKFQLLLLFRRLFEPSSLPSLNSTKAIEKYCSEFNRILSDRERLRSALASCAAILSAAVPTTKLRQPARAKAFTELIVGKTKNKDSLPQPPRASRHEGIVKHFSQIRGWGVVVDSSANSEVMFYAGGLRTSLDIARLCPNARIDFEIRMTAKGQRAVDVVLI